MHYQNAVEVLLVPAVQFYTAQCDYAYSHYNANPEARESMILLGQTRLLAIAQSIAMIYHREYIELVDTLNDYFKVCSDKPKRYRGALDFIAKRPELERCV